MFWRSDDKTSVLSGCKIAKALIVDDREREVGKGLAIFLRKNFNWRRKAESHSKRNLGNDGQASLGLEEG